MKILQIHNKYTQHGGEDTTVENEKELLLKNGQQVEQLFFDNKSIDFHVLYKSFYNKEAAKILKDKVKTFQPDVIHVHNFFYVASPAIFYAAQRLSIPVVLTLQNFRLLCSGALLLRNSQICELCVQKKFPISGIEHKCFQNSYAKTAHLTALTAVHKLLGTWQKKVDAFITLTPFLRHKFIHSSLQLDTDKIHIKPNFVQDFGFSGYQERQNFFLFVGRLSKEKGIDILLKAAQSGLFQIEIIGTGDLEAEVKQAAEVCSNIIYHGFRSKDFILQKLKQAKALVFPSIWYEGMPLTILEAFSTGTPVVVSEIDNLTDIVQHNKNGIYFQKGNAQSLIQILKSFKDNSYLHLYPQARSTYETYYNPDTNYKSLIKIYETVLEKKYSL